MPYHDMPFWTAAPLPFSPTMYPQNVLPPDARNSILAPKAPSPPPVNNGKKQPAKTRRKPPRRGSKGKGNRLRDANGMFISNKNLPASENDLLKSKVKE